MAIERRPLGRTGTDVSILGYGAMELRGQPYGPVIEDFEAGQLLAAVLDGGIDLIDTSARVALTPTQDPYRPCVTSHGTPRAPLSGQLGAAWGQLGPAGYGLAVASV